ncbi:TRADD-N-associated membrane domain-containing protein [Rhizobium sp. BR 314]|uniref:TRADD-N-associated membrane domain-containing protein n=1 Tax=Rhizobium sp. BR 314 TaxID=3040013 RepID=UPI0039BEF497
MFGGGFMYQLILTVILVIVEVLRYSPKVRWAVAIISILTIAGSFYVVFYLATSHVFVQGYEYKPHDLQPGITIGVVFALFMLVMVAFSVIDRDKLKAIVDRDSDDQLLRAWASSFTPLLDAQSGGAGGDAKMAPQTESAAKSDDDIIQGIKANLRQLIEYYIMNKSQARRSYTASLTAIVAGFGTIIGGTWWAFSSGRSDGTAYIVPLAGVLLQFIGGGYFYLYNRSLIQLNFFFSRLAQMQDTLLAIHLAESLPEGKERAKAVDRLIFIVAERSTTAPAYLPDPAAKKPAARRTRTQPEPAAE